MAAPGGLPVDALVRRSLARLAEGDEGAWFAALPADVRSWIGVVVHGGLTSFAASLDDPVGGARAANDAFAAVPASVTRAVTLQQTVDMVRAVVEVVEAAVPELAPTEEAALRSAVERYGREVAFAVARVYARAAERRGAWDARLHTLVIDALVADDDGRLITSRAATLGWPGDAAAQVLALPAPLEGGDALDALLHRARADGVAVVAALQAGALVVVLPTGSYDAASALAARLLAGTTGVLGCAAAGIGGAGRSASEALGGLAVLPALHPPPDPPRLVTARELLPERVLAGEPLARRELIEQVHRPLAAAGLVDTVDAVLAAGGALEPAARALPVHVNTLRHRLARVEALVGVDARSARGRLLLHAALTLARL